MPHIESNGIHLYYERSGSGRPLVLISGLGYGLWQWHKMIPGLAKFLDVVAFDNRGAGQTEKPAGPYSAQMLAADTAGLIDGLGLSSAIVMGHSMGGFVAQELALTRPELVEKLILASTNFGGPNCVPVTPEALNLMLDRTGDPVTVIRRGIQVATAPGFVDAHPDRVQELIDYRLTNPVPPVQYQAQLAVGLALIPDAASFEKRLKAIKAPTLVLFGEHDRVVPVGNAALLAREIPNSEVLVLPGAGHMFPIEVPDEANEAVLQFIRKYHLASGEESFKGSSF